MTFDEFLELLSAVLGDNPEFIPLVPSIVVEAETRIYRELQELTL